MKKNRVIHFISLAAMTVVSFAFCCATARAHCDAIDGPVVKAAHQALAEGNANVVLIWIKPDREREVKAVFEKTMAVRKLTPEARELADLFFAETVVRIHLAGEGTPYTGLKPAGRDRGPAIPLAEKALQNGDIKGLRAMLSEEMGRGLQIRFQEAARKAKFDKDNVAAGRQFVEAYTEFIHYVENLHESMQRWSNHDSGQSSSGRERRLEVTAAR